MLRRVVALLIAIALIFAGDRSFAEDSPAVALKPNRADSESIQDFAIYSRTLYTGGSWAGAAIQQNGWAEQAGMLYGLQLRQGLFSVRTTTDLAAGGGANGIDGHMQHATLAGLSVPILPNMRVFARAGIGGEYRGNDAFLYSHIDLPLGELGATYTIPGVMVNAGILGAYTAAGRFDIQGAEHVLDRSPMLGGFAELRVLDPAMFLRTELRSYNQGRQAGQLVELRASMCITLEGLAFCSDASAMGSGNMAVTGVTSRQSGGVGYVGLSFGYGDITVEHGK